MVLVNRKMQLAPCATCRDGVLFLMPLVFAVDFQSGAVDDDNASWFESAGPQNSWQIRRAFEDTAEVRDRDGGSHQPRNRGHEAFGLA